MATTAEYFSLFLDLELFAHFHVQKGFRSGLIDHHPVLAGTIPIGLDIPGSDLDVLCQMDCPKMFAEKLEHLFFKIPDFCLREKRIKNNSAVIASFQTEFFPVEIFGQKIHPTQQDAFIHMVNEFRILNWAGAAFKNKVIDLKIGGMKTEPAFGLLLGIESDPYEWLLKQENCVSSKMTLQLK